RPAIKASFNHSGIRRPCAGFWHAFLPIGQRCPITGPPALTDRRPFFCSAARLNFARVLYLIVKSSLSAALVAAVSEIAPRYAGWGGLVASLPLTSLLAMMW